MDNNLVFKPITQDDIQPLTDIMKKSFDEDARRHLGEKSGGPPGYDDGTFLTKYALNSPTDAFKVIYGNTLIGAIIVWINSDGNNYLGTIFVDPSMQDKGLGLMIWKHIESKYSSTKKWMTDTPGFSKRNHNFYVNKCGFKVIRIENPL